MLLPPAPQAHRWRGTSLSVALIPARQRSDPWSGSNTRTNQTEWICGLWAQVIAQPEPGWSHTSQELQEWELGLLPPRHRESPGDHGLCPCSVGPQHPRTQGWSCTVASCPPLVVAMPPSHPPAPASASMKAPGWSRARAQLGKRNPTLTTNSCAECKTVSSAQHRDRPSRASPLRLLPPVPASTARAGLHRSPQDCSKTVQARHVPQSPELLEALRHIPSCIAAGHPACPTAPQGSGATTSREAAGAHPASPGLGLQNFPSPAWCCHSPGNREPRGTPNHTERSRESSL